MKIYTRTGDKGQTSLYDGTRVDKDNIRVESYGTLDELNSYIGLCTLYAEGEDKKVLKDLQLKLFSVSGELATKKDDNYKNVVSEDDIKNFFVLFIFQSPIILKIITLNIYAVVN